ncbi:MAG: hypothetical protein V3U82_02910 [Robiginitomaculum sp.]
MSRVDIKTSQARKSVAVSAFKPITLILIALVGLISFSAFITLSGFEGEITERKSGRPHAGSKSPNGFAAIVHLLKSQDVEVALSRGEEAEWDQYDSLTVYTIARPATSEAIANVNTRGPTLFVMPKWRVYKSLEKPGRFVKTGLHNPERIGDNFKSLSDDIAVMRVSPPELKISNINEDEDTEIEAKSETDTAPDLTTTAPITVSSDAKKGNYPSRAPAALEPVTIDRLQSFSSPAFHAILTIDGKMVLGQLEDTQTYLLSEPDLLDNAGVKDYAIAANAMAMLDYLNPESDSVYFDLTLHGLGTGQNLIKVLLKPPFLAATLCLLATGLLLGWRAFTRFGAPHRDVRAYALGKQALANNSADLIRLAGRQPNMAKGYAALIKSLTARTVRAPKTLSDSELIATLDRMGRRSKTEYSLKDLTAQAEKVSDNEALMNLAQKLYKWRQEITHDTP